MVKWKTRSHEWKYHLGSSGSGCGTYNYMKAYKLYKDQKRPQFPCRTISFYPLVGIPYLRHMNCGEVSASSLMQPLNQVTELPCKGKACHSFWEWSFCESSWMIHYPQTIITHKDLACPDCICSRVSEFLPEFVSNPSTTQLEQLDNVIIMMIMNGSVGSVMLINAKQRSYIKMLAFLWKMSEFQIKYNKESHGRLSWVLADSLDWIGSLNPRSQSHVFVSSCPLKTLSQS